MKEILLPNGHKTIVDDDNYEYLNGFKWHLNSRGYVVRNVRMGEKFGVILMHRIVNKTPDHLITDHINRNRVDNRRENLRSCTYSENSANVDRSFIHSKYKKHIFEKLNIKNSETTGVRIQIKKYGGKEHKYITARIGMNGKKVHLGSFKTVKEANDAYKKALYEYIKSLDKKFSA